MPLCFSSRVFLTTQDRKIKNNSDCKAKQVAATVFYLIVCTYYSAAFNHAISQQFSQNFILDNRATNHVAKITVLFPLRCLAPADRTRMLSSSVIIRMNVSL